MSKLNNFLKKMSNRRSLFETLLEEEKKPGGKNLTE
jgi:hypothetical protein